MARSIWQAKGILNHFWAKARSVHVLNLSPTKAIMNQILFDAWRGRKPSVSYLRIFCCIAYALVNPQFHHKLDENMKSVFLLVIVHNPKDIDCITPLAETF